MQKLEITSTGDTNAFGSMLSCGVGYFPFFHLGLPLEDPHMSKSV